MELAFDSEILKNGLPHWRVEYHHTIDSTNRYATARANHIRMPTLIVAENQTAGKGRGQNRWWSAAGALTFSLAIRPAQWKISLREQTLLSLTTAAVLREALCQLGVVSQEQIQLKWPNDIYLQHRKVCGILLEQAAIEPEVLVIGIGLNVNNSWADAPSEIATKGIALCDVYGQSISREEVLLAFVKRFEQILNDATLRQMLTRVAWSQSHLLDDKIVVVQQGETTLSGRCEGVDEDGALLVRDTFSLHRIHSAVVLSWESAT